MQLYTSYHLRDKGLFWYLFPTFMNPVILKADSCSVYLVYFPALLPSLWLARQTDKCLTQCLDHIDRVGESSALSWCVLLSINPLLLVTHRSSGEQQMVPMSDSFGLFFCCSVATPAGKKDSTFSSWNRGAWGVHGIQVCERRFTQRSSEPQQITLGHKASKRMDLLKCDTGGQGLPQRWATAMGRGYITIPSWGKHGGQIQFFLALPTGLKKVMGERKYMYSTHRAWSCSLRQQPNICSCTLIIWSSVQCQFAIWEMIKDHNFRKCFHETS